MPRLIYTPKRFGKESFLKIQIANEIIKEYAEQGFDLTLRQLYYQFVSREYIPNNQKSYSNLGSLISDARLAGHVDWLAIQDRTRMLRQNSHWNSPKDIIHACAQQYKVDYWEFQNYRPEVWIEKDALIGVIMGICVELDVPYFSCRGYASQSEMWRAGQRLTRHINNRQIPVIFHFGDHDPSGKDMSRDIEERLSLFIRTDLGEADVEDRFEFQRVALTSAQIKKYKLPPNPAKLTDSRSDAYIAEFGESSWELDALDPKVIVELIQNSIDQIIYRKAFDEAKAKEHRERNALQMAADNWREKK